MCSRQKTRWTKLEGLAVKVNWDAAVNIEAKKVGARVIRRDSQGDIMACLYTSADLTLKPVETEAFALRRMMEFCLELGVQDAVFEGDALLVE